MAAYTKLKIVQKMLSATDLENVTAIGDTVESEQAAELVDTVYIDILKDYDWPFLYTISTLNVSANPNEMTIPDDKFQINWIRYNKNDITYIEPKDMIILLDSRDQTLATVDSRGCYIDRDPTYWTSYDDETITFDSYNGNLVAAYCVCQFVRNPGTLSSDDSVPDLPARFIPVLIAGCLAEAFLTLKGDDTIGQMYNKRFRLGMIDMKKWARKVASAKRTTESGQDYSRGLMYAMNTGMTIVDTSSTTAG